MLTPEGETLMIAGELRVLGDLVPRMPEDGLLLLRQMLREPSRWTLATPLQRLFAADLLDAVCRRLETAGFAPAAYFVNAGDMYPSAPDDTSSLPPDEGSRI
jgi:hypothetical protein